MKNNDKGKPISGGVELARVSALDADGYPSEAWAGVNYKTTTNGARDVYVYLCIHDSDGNRTAYNANVEGLGVMGECAAFVHLLASQTATLARYGFAPTKLAAFAGRVVDHLTNKSTDTMEAS